VPRDSRACQQTQPWADGLRRIQSGDSLRSGDCFALELTVSADSYVQLMYRDPTGNVYRLIPSQCDGLQGEFKVKAHHVAVYPSPQGQIPVIGLGHSKGTEKIYVIAARDAAARAQVQDIVGDFRDACSAGQEMAATRVAHWEQVLHQLTQQAPGRIEWQSFAINHI
jgi:hypothetical protein